jgi:Uma2 family endonuclease
VNSVTPAEYLELERQADWKSEYYRGKMCEMPRVNVRHVLIVANLAAEISQQLKNIVQCSVYFSALRLQVTPDFYTYPDVMAFCGQAQVVGDHDDIVTNPDLIIEVLSEASQDYDRGSKFERYRKLPSLVEYLTVAQDRPHIEPCIRRDEGWRLTDYNGPDETVVVVPVSEIYEKVDFSR